MIVTCREHCYASNNKETWEHQWTRILVDSFPDYRAEELKIRLVVYGRKGWDSPEYMLVESDLIDYVGYGEVEYFDVTWIWHNGLIYNDRNTIEI